MYVSRITFVRARQREEERKGEETMREFSYLISEINWQQLLRQVCVYVCVTSRVSAYE